MKTILFALFILLLAGGCASERYYTTYDYNFMHERNNVLIHGEGGTVPNAYVLVGETEFHFRLGTGGGRIQPYKKNLYTGGEYWLYLGVQPLDTQIKSVKTITLKRVTIRVGDDEFNMIKRISDIVPGITTRRIHYRRKGNAGSGIHWHIGYKKNSHSYQMVECINIFAKDSNENGKENRGRDE
jgi:hypothetical protein